MSEKRIRVVIEHGRATITTEGFVGTACKDATRQLERRLGVVESDDPTPEFHEVVPQTSPN